MLYFVSFFLLFIFAYHILITFVCYGIFGGHGQEIFSLIRDGIWILFILFVTVKYRKYGIAFLKKRKYPIIGFGFLLLFGISVSLYLGKNRSDILIGIKYGFWYLFIFLSAVLVGYVLALENKGNALHVFLHRVFYFFLALVIFGFIWQGMKLLWPDFFLQLGYGPLNDFAFGIKPPLYYLTGYEGTLRWQGIFAGPNNYGYFLVAFFAFVIYFAKSISFKKTDLINGNFFRYLMIALWSLAIVLTLSRSALIGSLLVIILLYKQQIKQYRKIFLGLFFLSILGLIGLSILKNTSTFAHLMHKFTSLHYVINQPWGYGLGSSGPAIHHHGNILPENYFIQLMIDIGTLGFLIWIFVISQIGSILKAIRKYASASSLYQIWKSLSIGRIALLIIGMFLHVFEDSMVNYSFFVLRGIVTGYLSFGLKGMRIGVWDFWKK